MNVRENILNNVFSNDFQYYSPHIFAIKQNKKINAEEALEKAMKLKNKIAMLENDFNQKLNTNGVLVRDYQQFLRKNLSLIKPSYPCHIDMKIASEEFALMISKCKKTMQDYLILKMRIINSNVLSQTEIAAIEQQLIERNEKQELFFFPSFQTKFDQKKMEITKKKEDYVREKAQKISALKGSYAKRSEPWQGFDLQITMASIAIWKLPFLLLSLAGNGLDYLITSMRCATLKNDIKKAEIKAQQDIHTAEKQIRHQIQQQAPKGIKLNQGFFELSKTKHLSFINTLAGKYNNEGMQVDIACAGHVLR
jgi:hypothetical protein